MQSCGHEHRKYTTVLLFCGQGPTAAEYTVSGQPCIRNSDVINPAACQLIVSVSMSVSVQTGAQQTPRHQQSSGTSSLLACVRESSPLPDPAEGDAGFDSYTGTTGTEPRSKKSRFHPLRGLRRMFRRKPRVEPTAAPESVPAGETVSGEPTGSSLLVPDNGGQPRSRSASELLGSSQELQAKRRSGGGLSGGSGGGSGCALGGGLSVSHDSVFTSDGRGGGGSPRGGSALQLPGAGELDGAGGGASASAHMLAPQPIASHAGVRTGRLLSSKSKQQQQQKMLLVQSVSEWSALCSVAATVLRRRAAPVAAIGSKLEKGSYNVRQPSDSPAPQQVKHNGTEHQEHREEEEDQAGWGHRMSAVLTRPAMAIFAAWCKIWAELFEAVRRRRRGRNGRRSEDEEDEDLGLPSSPYGGSPTTADVLMERSGIK
ncbi:hypothetical protein B566_EDAN005526, partial [Ephemera danica]